MEMTIVLPLREENGMMHISRRWMFRLASSFAVPGASGSQNQPDKPKPASERAVLFDMIHGLRWSQMLAVAAKLGIADELSNGPKSVQELAQATKTHQDSLYRVLRTLSSRGVFFEESGKRFRLTPAAALLRSGVPGSLRVTAQVMAEDWYWKSWGALEHTIATGETAFDHVYGMNTWDWFAMNPAAGALFNKFQTEGTLASTRGVMGKFDFTPFKVIADIGGGEGQLLAAILGTNLGARGILLDLPHVIAAAQKNLGAGLRGRIELVPGDFFRNVPQGGDLYVLKHIVHDWNDVDAEKILRACRRAMPNDGLLLVIDQVICSPNEACESKMSDVAMMVRNGGRNRTEQEYRQLLDRAGLSLRSVSYTDAGLGILEVVPEL